MKENTSKNIESNKLKSSAKGFTLLELLIVITIISVLSVILIVALNPAETLRKARDTQRLSDLASLKTAIGIYTTTITSPDLDGATGQGAGSTNMVCLTGTATTATIAYSSPATSDTNISCTGGNEGTDTGADFSSTDSCYHVTSANNANVDGSGWIPVDLAEITGGSPISNLPIDPVNDTATNSPTSATLTYRYACQDSSPGSGSPPTVFELNAVLESATFVNGGAEDKETTDGGDNSAYYEVGTSLRLIGDSADH